MELEKKEEIKNKMLTLWDSYEYKNQLAKDLMNDYIFGKYSNNEHFDIDELIEIVKEIEMEL